MTHPLVVDWLARLDAAARAAGVTASRRAELAAELGDHVAAALGEAADDVTVRAALDRLGDPEDVVAAEQGPDLVPPVAPVASAVPQAAPAGWSALEVLAVLALVGGGFVVPVLGPLVGLALAAGSPVWSRRDTRVTAVLVAGPVVLWAGFAVALYLGGGSLFGLHPAELLLLGALLSPLTALVAGVRLALRVGRRGA
ncbi:hypothetical protein [Kineosporia sp. A_224]|uniref:HAAS signaling domain-containing protein n=1 Tax=Kineosporia sp. A_224 TaxID=1962180 RepID=UPI000B4BA795|nr:hypothetical protein [Kineosporia sp. A_224]